jgi:hypothetical protein
LERDRHPNMSAIVGAGLRGSRPIDWLAASCANFRPALASRVRTAILRPGGMGRDSAFAVVCAVLTTGALAGLIVLGSRNLSHFDAALVAYTFAILFATFGLTYRYAMWLRRPPTALYWRRGWQLFFRPRSLVKNAVRGAVRVVTDVGGNRFIFRRDRTRGLAHFCIMWGCLLSIAITFPLVFGWLHFQPAGGDLERYQVVVFGFESFTFRVDSWIAFLLFHGLVWAALLVIAGVMLAMRRRMQEGGAVALQRFSEDIMPLVLLFSVAMTGLLLTASYTWMQGYAYEFISILHAATVIGTFLWLPFGKFFHVVQRPAQIGVTFYKDAGRSGESASCRRCGAAFTSRLHAEDLIAVERALGFRYEVDDQDIEHYQWICPPCRRASLALAQAGLWEGVRGGHSLSAPPGHPRRTPRSANPGVGEGPLGAEDQENFHP